MNGIINLFRQTILSTQAFFGARMAKHIPAAQRIDKARALIREARELPVPAEGGKYDFNYVLAIKSRLREARELVKLVPRTVGIAEEVKEQARQVLAEADQADRDIFHGEVRP